MARSPALFHFSSAGLVKARQTAFESKSPGCLKVLFSSPRWERRLLRFLELSGVGKTVEDAVKRRGGPPGWTGKQRKVPRRISNFSSSVTAHHLSFPFALTHLVKGGTHTPRPAHNATLRAVDFFCRGHARKRRQPVSFVLVTGLHTP